MVSLLVVAVGVTGLANTGGFYINPYDIAPRFATSICTATNTMATAAGVINPYVVAAVTKDVSTTSLVLTSLSPDFKSWPMSPKM